MGLRFSYEELDWSEFNWDKIKEKNPELYSEVVDIKNLENKKEISLYNTNYDSFIFFNKETKIYRFLTQNFNVETRSIKHINIAVKYMAFLESLVNINNLDKEL